MSISVHLAGRNSPMFVRYLIRKVNKERGSGKTWSFKKQLMFKDKYYMFNRLTSLSARLVKLLMDDCQITNKLQGSQQIC